MSKDKIENRCSSARLAAAGKPHQIVGAVLSAQQAEALMR
jgi:hypothetical protein